MELCEVSADSVDRDVGILEAEALPGDAHPGDPSLGDVEGAHAQRLPIQIHLCVFL